MMETILFLGLTAIAIALVVVPLLRRRPVSDDRAFDLTVYQDQLAELDRDLERRLIDPAEAAAAKVEIERRILAAGARAGGPVEGAGTILSRSAYGPAVLAVLVPLLSGLVYIQLGQPEMRDQPLAARRIAPEQNPEMQNLLSEIEQLEQHLATTPDNGAVWLALGRARLRLGEMQAAIEAFRQGVELLPNEPLPAAEYGEALVFAAGGTVTPQAAEQFEKALARQPNEARSRYYLGLSLAQKGDVDAALASWRELLEVSAKNAPWRPEIVQAIKDLATENGKDVEQIVAGLPEGDETAGGMPQPTAEDQAAMAALPAEEQSEQIRNMVDRLAARLESNPDDIDGWMRLGRSRTVLGEFEAARQAYRRALDLAPDRPDVLQAYAESLTAAEAPGDPEISEEAEEVYRRLVEMNPDEPEARWILGLAAAQEGNREEATAHWTHLAGLLEPGSQDHTMIKARLDALKRGEPLEAVPPGPAPTLAQEEAAADESASMPSAEDQAAMAALSPDERNERIRGMVEGLAARLEDHPDDLEGWLRLGQSRMVLGEKSAAQEAFRRATELDPSSPVVLKTYAASLLGEVHPATSTAEVGDAAADVYERVVMLTPDDPEANWYLGLRAVQEDQPKEAAEHWQKVLKAIGPDDPNYEAVQASLAEVQRTAADGTKPAFSEDGGSAVQ